MVNDGADIFRLGILGLALVGVANVLWLIRRSVEDPLALGPVTMSKRAWMRAVLLWNAIGIALLAFMLFAIWRP